MDIILLLLIAVIAIGGPIMYWLSNKYLAPFFDRFNNKSKKTIRFFNIFITAFGVIVLFLIVVYGIIDVDGNGSGWFN